MGAGTVTWEGKLVGQVREAEIQEKGAALRPEIWIPPARALNDLLGWARDNGWPLPDGFQGSFWAFLAGSRGRAVRRWIPAWTLHARN